MSGSKKASLTNKVVYSLALAGAVYVALVIWGNTDALKAAFTHLDWKFLPVILLLTLANYFFRFQNWQFYYRQLGIKVPHRTALMVYLSGFSMSITPGKVGEVVRSYLLKQAAGVPISKTISLTFVDRLTDMLALVVITTIGAYSFHYGQRTVWIVGLVILGLIIVISWQELAQKFLNLLKRSRHIAPHAEKLATIYSSTQTLLQPLNLIVITLLSILGWGCESVGFFVTLHAFGLDISLVSAMFIYGFSTIIGAISLLPGGLGLTEGSIATLLLVLDVPKGPAAAATLVIRACTLWFGVLLGSIFLILTQKQFGRVDDQSTKTLHTKAVSGKIG